MQNLYWPAAIIWQTMFRNEKQRLVVSLPLVVHIKYAHFWHNTTLVPITAVLEGFHMVLDFRQLNQFFVVFLYRDRLFYFSPSSPPLFLFSKCLSNFLVWEKTQINQNSFFYCLLEGSTGEGRNRLREKKVKKRQGCYANTESLSS